MAANGRMKEKDARHIFRQVKYLFDWDWPAAERTVKQAVLLDPSALENHACYLHSLETIDRPDDALRTVQLASAHHPSSIGIQSELGCAAYYAGRFGEAVVYLEQTLKSDPDNPILHWGIGRTLAQQGFETAAYSLINLSYASKSSEIELKRVVSKLTP